MLSSAFADGPFPRGHSRSAMKLSQNFRVHGIAPSRNRTKAPRSPVPRQLLKHPSRRPTFADGPSSRRHARITQSHPESSAGSAHVPTPPCHADRSRAVSLSLASLSRVPHPRAYSKAPHAPPHRHANFSNMLSSAFADGPSPHRHSRSAMKLSQSFRVHGIAPSRTTPKHRMRQPTANFSNTVSVAPLRGQLFSAQTYAPRHGTPLKPPWPR